MEGYDTDNNLTVRNVVKVQYNPVTNLTQPKVTIFYFNSYATFDYYTKSEAETALKVTGFKRIAIFDDGNELWAVLSTEWD